MTQIKSNYVQTDALTLTNDDATKTSTLYSNGNGLIEGINHLEISDTLIVNKLFLDGNGKLEIDELGEGGTVDIEKISNGTVTIAEMTGGSLSTTLTLSALKTWDNLIFAQPLGSYNNGNVPADDKKWPEGDSDKHQYFAIDVSKYGGTGKGVFYLIHCEVMYNTSGSSRHYLYYDSYGVQNGVQGCSGFDDPNISDPAGTLHLMCHKTPTHLHFQMYECGDATGKPTCNNDGTDFTFYAVDSKDSARRTCFNYIHVYRLPFILKK